MISIKSLIDNVILTYSKFVLAITYLGIAVLCTMIVFGIASGTLSLFKEKPISIVNGSATEENTNQNALNQNNKKNPSINENPLENFNKLFIEIETFNELTKEVMKELMLPSKNKNE